MPAIIHQDNDADLSLLENKTIAVLGYGSQGHAHAQNLRESGLRVIVAELPETDNHRQAVADGFQPVSAAEAVRQSDVAAVLLPDEVVHEVFRAEIRDHLTPGDVLIFAHGFNVRFGLIDVPEGVSAVLVAPLGPGCLVREKYVRGEGVPCLIATAEGAGRDAMAVGLAYAKGIGCTRAGAIETTFAEETETDLFGEQAVLCGGLSALMQAGFETLVEAGYQPEIAYLVSVHEVKQIVDLIHQGGLGYMRRCVSNTAEYGDYTRGPRIIDDRTKAEMRRILAEISDGRFAREWIEENRSGAADFEEMRRRQAAHSMGEIGRRMRELISGVNAKEG
ncbi:MAG: ketol-acid reductoisomerase [Planctomycetes bacterium]|nr:ketol-acid reductoisomerase [Planctomycetota bacterium]MBU4399616.1 ketol-acid reductoisomerase [Planctomycetota bacterium]MCG2683486.1 ketol-acid reductoisomerase [Planctomycetales bacterium]